MGDYTDYNNIRPAHMTFFRMHPTDHYEMICDSVKSIYVPRIGEHVLVKLHDSEERQIAKVVGVSYLWPAPGSPSHETNEGPIIDILVENVEQFFREDPNVVIPDEES